MGNPKAFLTIPRQEAGYRPVHERICDFSEVEQTLNTSDRKLQASRCMDCGVPFCHWACPLGNRPPEFQDAMYKGKWEEAYRILSRTNDFPEFTGRICPALCEKSCVLKLSMDAPVTIREDEAAVIEAVFEKSEYIGGLLRFGIPNFKLGKNIIDRRIKLMEEEGILFKPNTEIDVKKLPENFDAYCICTGTPQARDLNIPGRNLKGIYFAMQMLAQQNRILAGQTFSKEERINAKGKHVLVIGGGDQWPIVLKTSSSHEEGCVRRWSLASNKFIGKNGQVCGVEVEEVEWIPSPEGGRPTMKPTGKKEVIQADMVLLAMGFLKPEIPELPANAFLAGDAATGASLVVKCIAGGRKAAADIDRYLKM